MNRIDDEIIGRIRASRFIVADFTGHRPGVYFEAGMMLGLGRTDERTVTGFGQEWNKFDHSQMDEAQFTEMFSDYFSLFPWDELPPQSEGFDLGCGSGR